MSRKWYVFVVLLISVLYWLGFRNTPLPPKYIPAPITSLPDEKLEDIVKRFYTEALGESVHSICVVPRSGRALNLQHYKVVCGDEQRETHSTIDIEYGIIVSFFDNNTQTDYIPMETLSRINRERKELGKRSIHKRGEIVPKDELALFRSERDRIHNEWQELATWKDEYENYSPEEILEKLKPILTFLNVPPDIEYNDGIFNLDVPSLCRFVQYYEHEGVRFQNKQLRITVSRFSGHVDNLRYDPIITPPKTVVNPIDKKEAYKTAKKWLKDTKYFGWKSFIKVKVRYSLTSSSDSYKIITSPSNLSSYILNDRQNAYIESLPPDDSRFCWAVPFAYTEFHDFQHSVTGGYIVLVDMESGQVIGSRPLASIPASWRTLQ